LEVEEGGHLDAVVVVVVVVILKVTRKRV